MRTTLIALCAWLALAAISSAADRSFLFATLLREKKIITFERDPASGVLKRLGETSCPAEPACMATSRDRKLLLVSYRSSGQLASFRIDWKDGSLTPINAVDGGADPAYLLTDRTNKYLLAAYYQDNKVTVHRLDERGAISAAIQTAPTAQRAHGLAIDQANRQLFVPHTGANRIYQFKFDAKSGRLRPADPPFVASAEPDQPRHLVLHPSDRWAYTSNEAGDSIGVYAVNRDRGTLKSRQTVSTIPSSFDGAKNSTSRCEMTPNGRFVYVANRGHDSIAGFAINQDKGTVTALGQTKTEQTPRSFSIDSTGKFLYAAGQASGKIAAYRIGDDGELTRFATYPSGPVSWWVLVVDAPN